MIKFEYRPWTPDSDVDALFDPPVVEIVTMTLGDDVSWDEAVCEFKNFLRASGYVIPYDFEKEDEDDVYIDCSDPPDMDKSGSLGDRQPEWAMRMSEDDVYEYAEVDRLRAKKKAIHEDLFKDICKAVDEIKEREKRTDAQHERRSDHRNA